MIFFALHGHMWVFISGFVFSFWSKHSTCNTNKKIHFGVNQTFTHIIYLSHVMVCTIFFMPNWTYGVAEKGCSINQTFFCKTFTLFSTFITYLSVSAFDTHVFVVHVLFSGLYIFVIVKVLCALVAVKDFLHIFCVHMQGFVFHFGY